MTVEFPVGVSRQRKLQMEWYADGCCVQCGEKREHEELTRCDACTVKDRNRKRAKLGFKPGDETGYGRPAAF